MKNLFVYGTLRHVPLLEAVLGKAAAEIEMAPATLEGHSVFAVKDQDFPIIKEREGAAQGLWLGNLSATDVARLEFYEGGFDYDLAPVEVSVEGANRPAQVFKSDAGWQPDGPWSLENWAQIYGALTVCSATEEMSYFGVKPRGEVDGMLPMIKARAIAQQLAAQGSLGESPGGMIRADVRDVSVTRAYAKYFTLDDYEMSFRRYDGTQSVAVQRAVFVATDAVIVLPYDPVRDRVLLIEQFRPGPFARGDDLPWQLEPIAGRIDANEAPQETARREAQEEAGLALGALHEVSKSYASPGCSTEFYHIYIAIADLPDEVVGVSGLEQEAEDIRSFLYSFEDLMQMTDEMKLVNAPLVLASLWLARHRDRLRASA
ncbi:NUDIX domain-containing protein [Shimia marina]|uniref:ADP-ribose pyrophosphatase n=1 Tax=Shimia marina TaxID=321267 RepID=A0A0P1ETN5_9RHOB|nr:NUDIX domain-containing protein [Shimia marina]CUH53649.1 ADP-ribose pyrophosphatase [Shimia marina]SFD72025.1 nudix-type nucleoside diphosphatase, YffH/AdpP family [Shimia marina]